MKNGKFLKMVKKQISNGLQVADESRHAGRIIERHGKFYWMCKCNSKKEYGPWDYRYMANDAYYKHTANARAAWQNEMTVTSKDDIARYGMVEYRISNGKVVTR